MRSSDGSSDVCSSDRRTTHDDLQGLAVDGVALRILAIPVEGGGFAFRLLAEVEGLQDVSISVDEINGKIVGILAQLDLSAIEAVAVGRSNVAVDEHRLADPACRIRQTRTGQDRKSTL